MKYSTERHEAYVVIKLDEEKLTTSNAPQLKSDFVTLHTEGRRHVILDLSNVKYVDSSGLSAMLVANRLWNSTGGLFILCSLSEHVEKLITISQLQSTLNIAANRDEAIQMVFLNELEQDDEDEDDTE
ncbi:MAG: STAS domain-containing protein [Bacteroidia bacterium]|nr:STAS domain-containing protein [Bacteroidia bacterium]